MMMKRLVKWCSVVMAISIALPSCDDVEYVDEPTAAADDPPGAGGSRQAPIGAADLRYAYKNRIEVKLRERSGVRPRTGELAVVGSVLRGGPAPDLSGIRTVLAAARRHAFTAMHDAVTEAELDAMKRDGERLAGSQLPDLNLWTYLYVEVDSDAALAGIVNGLNRLDVVEVAEPSRIGVDAALDPTPAGSPHNPGTPEDARAPWPADDELRPVAERRSYQARLAARPTAGLSDPAREAARPPGTPDLAGADPIEASLTAPTGPLGFAPSYTANQRYKQAAPTGVDTDYLQGNYWNANGINFGYTDIEYAWNQNHVDLGAIAGSSALVYGVAQPQLDNRNHGTAVIGELSSTPNAYGTTGMVPGAGVRLAGAITSSGYNLAGALSAATSQFTAGAAILIEQQTCSGIDCNGDGVVDCTPNNGIADDYIPSEYASSVRAAISTATANGRIVVAAAGNGNCNLDLAGYGGYFGMGADKDSGAIIVGAGERDTRDRASFSTYGARVDTHAEGDWQVTTTGYGGLYSAEGENHFYDAGFAGTSAASPIVTGSVVALQSILWFYNGSIYNPRELRDLLRRDGTAQGTGRTGHVGPRPDLRRQISHMHGRHLQIESADFDGDNRADYTVFRPSNGTWYVWFSATNTATAVQWGQLGDIPVPADVSGDGRAELIVFRPSNGTWYIRSWDGSSRSVQWGTLGDTPVPMDFDGDGKAQLAVVRPPSVGGTTYARWHILSQDESWYNWADWGEWGDSPIAADFNGDGRADLAQFRGTTGMWYVAYANGGSGAVQWGAQGDIPLVRRVAGGVETVVWRPSTSRFYRRSWNTGATAEVHWGDYGDMPRFADTDGDGVEEHIVYRSREGAWYNVERWHVAYWGGPGDIPALR